MSVKKRCSHNAHLDPVWGRGRSSSRPDASQTHARKGRSSSTNTVERFRFREWHHIYTTYTHTAHTYYIRVPRRFLPFTIDIHTSTTVAVYDIGLRRTSFQTLVQSFWFLYIRCKFQIISLKLTNLK